MKKLSVCMLLLLSALFTSCSEDEKNDPQALTIILNGEKVRFNEIKSEQTGESASIDGVPHVGKLLTITGIINKDESIVIEVLDWAQLTVVSPGLNSKTYSNILGEQSAIEGDCEEEGKCDGFNITYYSAGEVYKASFSEQGSGYVTITNNWDGTYSGELSNELQNSSAAVTGTFAGLPVRIVATHP